MSGNVNPSGSTTLLKRQENATKNERVLSGRTYRKAPTVPGNYCAGRN
jgi:hypothetical protein